MPGKRIAKIIRVTTVAPIPAVLLLLELHFFKEGFFGGTLNLAFAVLFLSALPMSAYPLQPLFPKYRGKGREGQRSLAIAMSFAGYCMGLVSAAATAAPGEVWIVYLTYFLSGLLIILFNKVLKVRASGHACGVAGPIFASIYFTGPWALIGLVLLAAVYWASLNMGRHSLRELLVGTAIPAAAMFISIAVVGL